MKIFPFAVACGVSLLVSQTSFAKVCAIDVDAIEVGGIRLGQSDTSFFAQHPTAKAVVMPIDNHQIELSDSVDDSLKSYGVTGVGHIGHNPVTQRISSFSLSFLDGGLATYETDLGVFKKRILEKFNLPKTGWKKTNYKTYEYRCDDYIANIVQDHGAEHTAIGPTVMVFSRYMDDWKKWKNTE